MSENVQNDRKATMLKNVQVNARSQANDEHRENYFRSCEAHGGDLAEVVAVVRKEYSVLAE